MMRLAERPKAAAPLVRAQRKASGGGGAPVPVPRLDGGRPLDGATRGQMESGFGRDFGQVRIHDGPQAAESARAAGALAYTAGQDIVFGAGQYAPGTPSGAALLAHELAHTVQQGGVQHKAEGPPAPGTDHALEAEADRAAGAITSGRPVSALTRMAAPALMRATEPPSSGTSVTPAAQPPTGLPPGMSLIKDDPEGAGATMVRVQIPTFELPKPKGKGKWVKDAYKAAGDGGRLVFTPLLNGGKVAAWKEGTEDYQSIWLANLGYSDMKSLGAAITASTEPDVVAALTLPQVKKAVDGMTKGGLKGSGFDIDHIVEKQIGGTSIPTNLQLLVSAKNQASGRETYQKMVEKVVELRKQEYRPKAKDIQIVFAEITVPEGDPDDPCYLIETFLRAGKVKGSAEIMKIAGGVPVALSAGGHGETIMVGMDETSIDGGAKRVVPGMKLTKYKRAKGKKGVPPGADEVTAELDSRAISKSGASGDVAMVATVDTGPVPDTSVGGVAKEKDALAAGPGGERRKLTFKAPRPKKIGFYYPYLSPGELTAFSMDDKGGLSGTGLIHPTLKFLPDVKIAFGPDKLEATALDAKKFKSPIPGINFTEGELKLVLADASGAKFEPSGNLKIAIGPAAKPIILGSFDAFLKDSKLAGKGELIPAQAIPGIKEAKGEFSYDAANGWAGKLTASSTKIPNSTVDVVIGFRQEGEKFVTYAEGGIKAAIRDKTVDLRAKWGPNGLVYTGGLEWPKPFPIVENVSLKGTYAASQLDLSGETRINYRTWNGKFNVFYRQKDGQSGKLWGSGEVHVETKNKKAIGDVKVAIDDAGELTGQGEISYALTDKITPKLGVKLGKGGHLTIMGSVKVAEFQLFPKWPEKGGERELIKGAMSFKIPTPIPAVNAAINVDAGVGISYGIGPGKITGIELTGQFDPLEENPNVTASLKGRFVIPTYFALTGKIGARIGVEVAGGAVGVDGGVTVRPSIGVSADAIVDISANYEKGAFDFTGKAFIEVTPVAKLGVDLTATMYAGWHLLQYEWSYPVAALSYKFPQQIKINVGEVGYSTAGSMRWPKLSDVSIEPKDISPLKMMQDVMAGRKTSEKSK